MQRADLELDLAFKFVTQAWICHYAFKDGRGVFIVCNSLCWTVGRALSVSPVFWFWVGREQLAAIYRSRGNPFAKSLR